MTTLRVVMPEEPVACQRSSQDCPFYEEVCESAERAASCIVGGVTRSIRRLTLLTDAIASHLGLPADLDPEEATPILAELETLSSRERIVLRSVLDGKSAPEIGAELHISPHTVRNHLRSIYRKIGVRSAIDLVRRFHSLRSLV